MIPWSYPWDAVFFLSNHSMSLPFPFWPLYSPSVHALANTQLLNFWDRRFWFPQWFSREDYFIHSSSNVQAFIWFAQRHSTFLHWNYTQRKDEISVSILPDQRVLTHVIFLIYKDRRWEVRSDRYMWESHNLVRFKKKLVRWLSIDCPFRCRDRCG